MKVTYTCKKSQVQLKDSGLIPRLKKNKHLQSVLVRIDAFKGLRLFIREEIGPVQHVAWLGENEALDWTNSHIVTHFHYSKKDSNEGKIQPRTRIKKSSGLHTKKTATGKVARSNGRKPTQASS